MPLQSSKRLATSFLLTPLSTPIFGFHSCWNKAHKNDRLAGGSASCIIKIMKNIVRMLPNSVLETCYGSRLETMNGFAFIELTYKLLVSIF